jgi:hypothetical protein
MSPEPELEVADPLRAGREALSRGEWEQARAYFEAAHERSESAEAIEALAMAAWWLDNAQLAIESRERALVVALGADLAPGATPGLEECGYEFYSPDGAARVRDLLPTFPGGNVVIAVLGGFFKCPPAPYETAFMLHDYLSRQGVRDAATIHLVTPMPKPIPPSAETSDAIIGLLDERGIRHETAHDDWLSATGRSRTAAAASRWLSAEPEANA